MLSYIPNPKENPSCRTSELTNQHVLFDKSWFYGDSVQGTISWPEAAVSFEVNCLLAVSSDLIDMRVV